MAMMVIALTVVTLVATLLLGVTDLVTREPIHDARRAMLHRTLEQVLPPHANSPMDDKVTVKRDGKPIPVYVARDGSGHILAFAWVVVAPDGYSGAIHILIGVKPDGAIYAVRVTEHQETPGLGDGIVRNKPWVHSFSGKTLENTRWAVKKDGGDFDQFTGATITPRAVVKAVKKGLEFFQAHRQTLLNDAHQSASSSREVTQ